MTQLLVAGMLLALAVVLLRREAKAEPEPTPEPIPTPKYNIGEKLWLKGFRDLGPMTVYAREWKSANFQWFYYATTSTGQNFWSWEDQWSRN